MEVIQTGQSESDPFFLPKSELVCEGEPHAIRVLFERTWDRIAIMFGKDGNGYSSAKEFGRSFKRKCEDAKERLAAAFDREGNYRLIVDVLEGIVEQCGSDTLVGDPLELLTNYVRTEVVDEARGHTIEVTYRWDIQFDSEKPFDGKPTLYLVKLDRPLEVCRGDDISYAEDMFGPFRTQNTWAEELDRYTEKQKAADKEIGQAAIDMAVAAYQFQIATDLLERYSETMKAPILGAIIELDLELAQFIEAACIAFQADPPQKSRNPLLLDIDTVRQVTKKDENWADKAAIRCAKRLRAYEKTTIKGPPPIGVRTEQLAYFKAVVRCYVKDAEAVLGVKIQC